MNKKVALITGITGQDGSYLAELLLRKNYEIHGIRRRTSLFNTKRIDNLLNFSNFNLHYGDMTDYSSLNRIISEVNPCEIYNLAAQSHVGVSFETSEYTGNVDAFGTLRILEIVKSAKLESKVYQASTSELFGANNETPQNEISKFKPVSPYAIAKLYSYKMAELYRNAYGLFVSNGILFNHESPKRGETFISRKITMAVARIFLGSKEVIKVGNINSVRDWGHAKDYVYGMWLILQHSEPDDFVLATGVGHTVKDLINYAFKCVNLHLSWQKSGIHEKAYLKKNKQLVVEVDETFYRPLEVPKLIGDPSKAALKLNWKPAYTFEKLIQEMVESDIKLIQNF